MQAKIGDIVSYGEQAYFSMVSTVCATPSEMKSKLFDIGIDWIEISDFNLFTLFLHLVIITIK